MALLEGVVTNFSTLVAAVKANDVALVECHDKNGRAVPVICAINQDANGVMEMVPLAKMFMGDPYEEVVPPGPDDDEEYPACPVCGNPIDYCQGHGTIAPMGEAG